MPRALIVTYQWLPMFSAGVRLMANLCRYLPAADWEPHILTKDWTDGPAPEDSEWGMSAQPLEGTPSLVNADRLPVVRTPYGPRDNRWLRWHARLHAESGTQGVASPDALARRALDASYARFGHYPDMQRGWEASAVDAGLATVRQYGISAVLSVSSPATSHIVGGEIARRANIPWVVLFAELRSFNVGQGDGRTQRRRREARTLARRWLEGASRSAASSPRILELVRETYGIDGEVVVGGFDPEERRVAPHRTPGAPMRLVHTGSIHAGDQHPEMLFDALDMLVAAEPVALQNIIVEMTGGDSDGRIAMMLRGRACETMVRLNPRVSPAEAVRLQREADVLLLFNRTTGASYSSTIFEHLNAARPTIAIGADAGGFVTQVLAETRAGDTASDVSVLVAILHEFRAELRDSGIIAFRGDDAAISRYAAPEQAKRLGALIDGASGERFGAWERARR